MTCPVCAHSHPGSEAIYCPYCGARLAEPATAPLWVLDRGSNLFNRHFMEATLGQEYGRSQRYNRPLSFILIQIADASAKHSQAILAELRQALSLVLRDTDTLGHWGPSPLRFAIILPETPPTGAVNLLTRLDSVPLLAGQIHCGIAGVLGTQQAAHDLPEMAAADLMTPVHQGLYSSAPAAPKG
jgi:GGDEF domain-containing protein